MKWNDLESTWRQQIPASEPARDPAELRQSFAAKSQRQARHLLWQDLRSVAASAFVIGYLIYLAGTPRLAPYRVPVALALVPLLAVGLHCVFELLRRRRARISPHAPLLARLEADLDELRHHHHRLVVIAPWYLAAIFVSALFVMAAPWLVNGEMLPAQARKTAGFIALFVVILIVAVLRNRREARRQTEPRLRELQQLHDDLLAK